MATFSRDTIYAPLRTARLYNLSQELVGGSRVLHHLTDQQIGEILGLARACLRPSGRFIFYEPCFSANDDWLGRMFMRLDRGGNIKSDQALRALVSEYFAAVEEYIRRPVYLFRYTIQALIARNPRAES